MLVLHIPTVSSVYVCNSRQSPCLFYTFLLSRLSMYATLDSPCACSTHSCCLLECTLSYLPRFGIFWCPCGTDHILLSACASHLSGLSYYLLQYSLSFCVLFPLIWALLLSPCLSFLWLFCANSCKSFTLPLAIRTSIKARI